jgi:hypothetical protein
MQQAQLEAALTQARSQQQTDDFARRDRGHRYSAADAFMGNQNMEAMAHLMRGNQMDQLGNVNMAFGGEQLAQGQATEDMQRARMSGAGIQPSTDLALTRDTADRLREEDASRSLEQALGVQGLQNQGEAQAQRLRNQGNMEQLEFGYQNPTSAEHAMLLNDQDPAEVHRHMNPLSADQTLAATLGGDSDRLGHVRYGYGPQADESKAATGGGSPLSLEQALVGHHQDDPEALDRLYQLRHGRESSGPGIGDVARWDSTVMGVLDTEFPEVPFETRSAVARAVSEMAQQEINAGRAPHFPTLINRALTEQFDVTPEQSWGVIPPRRSQPPAIQPRQPQPQRAPQGGGGIDPDDPLGIRTGPGA